MLYPRNEYTILTEAISDHQPLVVYFTEQLGRVVQLKFFNIRMLCPEFRKSVAGNWSIQISVHIRQPKGLKKPLRQLREAGSENFISRLVRHSKICWLFNTPYVMTPLTQIYISRSRRFCTTKAFVKDWKGISEAEIKGHLASKR